MDLVIAELSNSTIRGTGDRRYSVYDLIRIVGGKKNPHQAWETVCQSFPELLQKVESVELGEGRARKVTPVATVENLDPTARNP